MERSRRRDGSIEQTREVVHDVITRSRTPGDLLLHPVAIVALALVILNDRLLKVSYPGGLSGKLSDVAGLVYFPLFLVSVLEGIRWLARRRPWTLTVRSVVVACVVVGTAMVLIKTWGPAGDVYRVAVGMAYWPFYVPASVVAGDGWPPLERVELVQDRWDLVALAALVIPVWVARRVMDDAGGVPGQ